MTRADICLILEGAYPYVLGGVSSWTHALIQSAPDLKFHVVCIVADSSIRRPLYELPRNVVACTDIPLDSGFPGCEPNASHARAILELGGAIETFMKGGNSNLGQLTALLARHRLGHRALFDTRSGWLAMETAYTNILPNAPLLDFYWTWRVIARGLVSVLGAALPPADLYHAISTGYAGLLGARARQETGRPLLLTEHGIYTNERRVELALSEWLFHSDRNGFDASAPMSELRDLWITLFASLARTTYDSADEIITLYRGNQALQLADGAASGKLRIVPNGVDHSRLSAIQRAPGNRRPTVALIGRVVPIKDVRMFIHACASLRRKQPDLEALVIGPDDEDPTYAAECRRLVAEEGLEACLRFTGRGDVAHYLARIDICVLTSISEAQPLVLLEAGAAGIPSVATDVGSCREIIEGSDADPVSGAGGMVVPVGDSAATASAMAALLSDAGLRERMGEVMRRRVAQFYNKERIDQTYRALYDFHLGRAPPELARAS